MAEPTLVVVTGMPATGKTTLARGLGARTGWPVVEKDRLKEALYDTLGVGDVDWSRRLGTATYALIFEAVRANLAAGVSTIAEANFFRGTHEQRFAHLPPHRLVQVHCHAPLATMVERYTARMGDRHPGHLDADRVDEMQSRYESGLNGPLELPGMLIELDTSGATPEELAETVSRTVGV